MGRVNQQDTQAQGHRESPHGEGVVTLIEAAPVDEELAVATVISMVQDGVGENRAYHRMMLLMLQQRR